MTSFALPPHMRRLAELLREAGFQASIVESRAQSPQGVWLDTESPSNSGVQDSLHVPVMAPVHQARWVLSELEVRPRGMLGALQDAPLVFEEEEVPEEDTGILEPLVDLHQGFDVLLLQHRLGLMRADVEAARRAFVRFARLMREHIEHETEWVLGTYERSAEAFERGSAPVLFYKEHEKIEMHLQRVEQTLKVLARASAKTLEVRCLRLLDREKLLADLLEHHDLRERSFLYPQLAKVLPPDEQRALVERMGRLNWAP